MKKTIALMMLFILSSLGWAAVAKNPADYNVKVHVSASRLEMVRGSDFRSQILDVVIDGKKYILESDSFSDMVLTIGDYRAKLIKNERRGNYESLVTYEFLLTEEKTRQFVVIGQTE